MTVYPKEAAKNIVEGILGTIPGVAVHPGRICIGFYDDFVLKFEHLDKLSEVFGTKRIDVDYCQETEGYSSYTPGDPASLTITVYTGN